VELGAPGVDIVSTLPLDRGKYGKLSGTSMAAPFVSGGIALLLAEEPSLSVEQVLARLQRSADPAASLAGKTAWGARLNVARALRDEPGQPVPGEAPGCGGGVWLPSGLVLFFTRLGRRRRGLPVLNERGERRAPARAPGRNRAR
jgi:hypothetical protein